MIGKKVREGKPVTLVEALAILELRRQAGEFGYEQQATYDYLKRFAKIDLKQLEAMLKELAGVEKLTPEASCKIVDIMPVHKSQLEAILKRDKVELDDKEAEKVIAIVLQYRPTEEEAEAKEARAEEEKKAEKAAAEKAGEEKADEKKAEKEAGEEKEEAKKKKAEKKEEKEKEEKPKKETKKKEKSE